MIPNSHKLPKFLHFSDREGGYYLDWRVKVGAGERRKRKTLGFIPKAQALRIHAEFYQEMLNKRVGLEDKPECFFREAAESFLAYSKAYKKSWKDDERTIKHLVQFFGDCTLESMDLSQVEKYEFWRQEETRKIKERKLRTASMNREKACLRALVRKAVFERKLDRNPLEGLRLPDEKNVRNRTLSYEEYQALLMACAPHIRPVIELANLTGMRKGEILGLRWSQVDFVNRVIILGPEDTKTGFGREIPLDDGLVELLGDQKAKDCPYVFSFKGRAVWDVKTAFNKACERAGIKDFRFHDLRHCAVTRMRKAGNTQAVIMSISGHKTDAMFRRYDRIDRADRREALKRVRKLDEGENGDFLETSGSLKQSAA